MSTIKAVTTDRASPKKRSFLKTADQTAAQATSSGFRVRDRHLGIQTTIKSCERDDLRNGLIAHPAARILGILLEQRAASGQRCWTTRHPDSCSRIANG